MKITLALLLLAVLISAPSFAADTKPASQKQTIQGHLVDVACATENAQKPKAGFAEKHDKDCLTMPDCVETGYSVLTADNKVIKFDKQGNEQAKKLIAETNKKADWKIAVTGTVNGDTIAVDSLKLQ